MFNPAQGYPTHLPGRIAICGLASVLVLLGVLVGVGISGCATSTPASTPGMTPQDLNLRRSHPYSIRVEVQGGRNTDPKGVSQISNQALRGALIDAIRRSGLFAKVMPERGADYLLRLGILELEQSPPRGFSMTARMKADWALFESDSGTRIWTETFASSYTASAISSRKAVTRMRLATEGAARENIRRGLERISRLALE